MEGGGVELGIQPWSTPRSIVSTLCLSATVPSTARIMSPISTCLLSRAGARGKRSRTRVPSAVMPVTHDATDTLSLNISVQGWLGVHVMTHTYSRICHVWIYRCKDGSGCTLWLTPTVDFVMFECIGARMARGARYDSHLQSNLACLTSTRRRSDLCSVSFRASFGSFLASWPVWRKCIRQKRAKSVHEPHFACFGNAHIRRHADLTVDELTPCASCVRDSHSVTSPLKIVLGPAFIGGETAITEILKSTAGWTAFKICISRWSVHEPHFACFGNAHIRRHADLTE